MDINKLNESLKSSCIQVASVDNEQKIIHVRGFGGVRFSNMASDALKLIKQTPEFAAVAISFHDREYIVTREMTVDDVVRNFEEYGNMAQIAEEPGLVYENRESVAGGSPAFSAVLEKYGDEIAAAYEKYKKMTDEIDKTYGAEAAKLREQLDAIRIELKKVEALISAKSKSAKEEFGDVIAGYMEGVLTGKQEDLLARAKAGLGTSDVQPGANEE